MEMMKKRVYGILGISSIMSNWNADFSGYPKSISNGRVFGSDKAFKYPMKKMWENQGEKVLYIKSLKVDKGVLIPKTLKERYEQLFPEKKLDKNTETIEVIKNLFKAIDVKNFGATFAYKEDKDISITISITGAVQIGQGFNFYDESSTEVQDILSPFRDPKGKQNKETKENEEAKNSTLGTKIVSDEAHYFYPFNINPLAYKEFVELEITDGYTEEDYLKFKETALSSATSFATNSKVGCDNEFGLFIETEEDFYLPTLTQYIKFEKGEEKNKIILNLSTVLKGVENHIKNIEIYYNPVTTEIVTDISNCKLINILTKKEV
ncbi:type I CRISPR-associated protein Cas7 [Fusobacterium sp. 1001295B_180824_G3]|uniref:type I CRISPR-associated protein Cas7 n=1 Tax=Fusobacterium sp. 1001295B_180824_G3 TaxID=2787123 RepID=UPI001E383131|nr:type I CRISPR-associated protein Cas7 [Fusobacterium sp. 1001295B_180824_G3]